VGYITWVQFLSIACVRLAVESLLWCAATPLAALPCTIVRVNDSLSQHALHGTVSRFKPCAFICGIEHKTISSNSPIIHPCVFILVTSIFEKDADHQYINPNTLPSTLIHLHVGIACHVRIFSSSMPSLLVISFRVLLIISSPRSPSLSRYLLPRGTTSFQARRPSSPRDLLAPGVVCRGESDS